MVDLPASTWPMKTRSCDRGQIGWMSEMAVNSSTILQSVNSLKWCLTAGRSSNDQLYH
jgi:hypothetical protein